MWWKGGVGSGSVVCQRVCCSVGGGGCVCTTAVCPVIVSPQTVEDLSEKHPTVHLVRANVCLLLRQAAAGGQVSEGLKGELKY